MKTNDTAAQKHGAAHYGDQTMTIERFEADDGDGWFSVVADGDVVTGVMHATNKEAVEEMHSLESADYVAARVQ